MNDSTDGVKRCPHGIAAPTICGQCTPPRVTADLLGEPMRFAWELTVDRLTAAVEALTKQLVAHPLPSGEPAIRLAIYLSPIGYQVDSVISGERATTCRDFGDEHPVPVVQERLLRELERAFKRFREGL